MCNPGLIWLPSRSLRLESLFASLAHFGSVYIFMELLNDLKDIDSLHVQSDFLIMLLRLVNFMLETCGSLFDILNLRDNTSLKTT